MNDIEKYLKSRGWRVAGLQGNKARWKNPLWKNGPVWFSDEEALRTAREEDARKAREDGPVANFQPGEYRHYKGGTYTALTLVRHHDVGMPYVLYVSHDHPGKANIRPLIGTFGDEDGWSDVVGDGDAGTWLRFSFVTAGKW